MLESLTLIVARDSRMTQSVVVPERRQGLGHSSLLKAGQSAPEFPFDDLEMVRECRVVTSTTLGRQHHADAASVARHGFAADESGGLDPIDEAGQAAPSEQGSLFEFLHPEPILRRIVELGQHVEPGQREPGPFDEVELCDPERP